MSDVPLSVKERLKNKGHEHIDMLVKMGFRRATVYKRLARLMGVDEPSAHFGAQNDIAVIKNMVSLLQGLENETRSKILTKQRQLQDKRLRSNSTPKRTKTLKPVTLSHAEARRAIAAAARANNVQKTRGSKVSWIRTKLAKIASFLRVG